MMSAGMAPDFSATFAGPVPQHARPQSVTTEDRAFPVVIPLVLGSILFNLGWIATVLVF